jgi:putative aldouronate transport system permease protein
MVLNVGLVPWYLTISNYGLIDSFWALVLPTAVPIWNVIILMNFFRNIPKELDDAARIDGANPWQTLWHVYLPVSLPALATITLFSVVGHWNSFFDGLILMNNPDNYPLQTYIQQLVIADRPALHGGQAQLLAQLSNNTLNAAKLFIAMIPILMIYPFLQRFFVRGIMLGSVKE